MLVYLLVGLAGVPVFTGGSAGPRKLFGPTGGYIIGLPCFTAVFLAYFRGEKYNFKRYALLGLCYRHSADLCIRRCTAEADYRYALGQGDS